MKHCPTHNLIHRPHLARSFGISQYPINRLTTYRKLPHFAAKSGRLHNLFYDQRSTKSIETRVDQYTEGTLKIDVVDATTKKLEWESRVAGWITEKDVHNMEQTVDEVVAAVMNNVPILPSGAHWSGMVG